MALRVKSKLTPTKGYAHVFHLFLSAIMPLLAFVFIRIGIVQLAFAVVLITKWRMFAVKPRFWPAIFRANAVDIMIALGTVIFMTQTTSAAYQIFWTILHIIWQVAIKPGRSILSVSFQALLGQSYGLMALYLAWSSAPIWVLVILVWGICYLSARHFLTSFEEQYTSLYSHAWGYFGAGIAWLSAHWLLYYSGVSMPSLLLTVIGFGLGGLYFLQESDKLSKLYKQQIVFIMIVVVFVVLALSDWGDNTFQ